MPRGGYRENAGWKQGAPNKATATRQAEVAASGITPLEVMLDNVRVAHQRAKELEKLLSDLPPEELEARLQLMGEIARQRLASQKCAADAANYVHPKLAAISHANDADHLLTFPTKNGRTQCSRCSPKAGSTCIEHRPSDESRRPQRAPSHR
jgi:hypothetical protein